MRISAYQSPSSPRSSSSRRRGRWGCSGSSIQIRTRPSASSDLIRLRLRPWLRIGSIPRMIAPRCSRPKRRADSDRPRSRLSRNLDPSTRPLKGESSGSGACARPYPAVHRSRPSTAAVSQCGRDASMVVFNQVWTGKVCSPQHEWAMSGQRHQWTRFSARSSSDQSAPGRCAPSLSTRRNARPPGWP